MERISLGLVRAVVAVVSLLASGSCGSKHEHSAAGAGGITSAGSGGENTGGSAGTHAGSGSGGARGGAGGENVAGSDAGSGVSGGPDATQCDTAADCAYGEIDHEIVKKSDCICRFGCPYIPLNKTTIERRNASYTKLCDSSKDGQGQPCPVDDCVPLGTVVCDDHVCRGAPR